jgi:hypothetical protein
MPMAGKVSADRPHQGGDAGRTILRRAAWARLVALRRSIGPRRSVRKTATNSVLILKKAPALPVNLGKGIRNTEIALARTNNLTLRQFGQHLFQQPRGRGAGNCGEMANLAAYFAVTNYNEPAAQTFLCLTRAPKGWGMTESFGHQFSFFGDSNVFQNGDIDANLFNQGWIVDPGVISFLRGRTPGASQGKADGLGKPGKTNICTITRYP